jgi:hypothetical protein
METTMMNKQHEEAEQTQSPAGEVRFITKQPADESLGRVFLGATVQNGAGETIGDIHDVMFDHDGRITSVLLGVGGFIGLGEKIIAVPFSDLAVSLDDDGTRSLVVPLDKKRLEDAPSFVATEKTTMDSVSDLAEELGKKAAVKARQIKDQAVTAVDEWRK